VVSHPRKAPRNSYLPELQHNRVNQLKLGVTQVALNALVPVRLSTPPRQIACSSTDFALGRRLAGIPSPAAPVTIAVPAALPVDVPAAVTAAAVRLPPACLMLP